MYMVPPFVYEKLKKCLDKVDTQTIEKINKPYFIPPAPQQNIQNINPMIPPNPPPPPIPFDDPVDDTQNDPNVSMPQMDWDREWDYPQYQPEEEEDFLDDTPLFGNPANVKKEEEVIENPDNPDFDVWGPRQSEISTQTEEKKPRQYHFSTQTETPRQYEIGTQTETEKQKQLAETGVQTENAPVMAVTNVPPKLIKRPIVITKTVKKQYRRPIKKQIQALSLPPTQGTPMDQLAIETDLAQPIQQMEIDYERTRPRALLPPETYPIIPVRQRQISSSVPRFRAHLEHMGQPVPVPNLTQVRQPKQITYETQAVGLQHPTYTIEYPSDESPGERLTKRQYEAEIVPPSKILKATYYNRKKPKQITYEQKQLVPQQTRLVTRRAEDIELPMDEENQAVGLIHPRYTIEYPAEEPPGERIIKRQYEPEIVHPSKIIKATYYKRRKLNNPNEITQPRELERYDDPHYGRTSFMSDPNFGRYGLPKRNINLADSKKRFQCDRCGLTLSTRYNLLRHQEREEKRFSKGGELKEPSEEESFITWNKPSKKRTSSETQEPQEPRVSKKMIFKKWNDS